MVVPDIPGMGKMEVKVGHILDRTRLTDRKVRIMHIGLSFSQEVNNRATTIGLHQKPDPRPLGEAGRQRRRVLHIRAQHKDPSTQMVEPGKVLVKTP